MRKEKLAREQRKNRPYNSKFSKPFEKNVYYVTATIIELSLSA